MEKLLFVTGELTDKSRVYIRTELIRKYKNVHLSNIIFCKLHVISLKTLKT